MSNLPGRRRMEVASRILAALISRPDSGLFNYAEMADMACNYAEALEKRVYTDEDAKNARMQAAMNAL